MRCKQIAFSSGANNGAIYRCIPDASQVCIWFADDATAVGTASALLE